MRSLSISCLLFLLAAISLPAQFRKAQPEEQTEPTIKVDVDLVNLYASVRDKKGALIPNLNKDDFEVLEDGKPQTISFFGRETDLPLTLGLLVDVSLSQARLIDVEHRAASAFFSQVLRKKDLAFLISFGSEAELMQDVTGSTRALEKALDDLRLNSDPTGMTPGPVPTASKPRGTILYDAVYLAANEKLRSEVGRKAIILITDGVDQGSRVKLEKAVESAQKSDAIIYGIYYVDPSAYAHGGFYYNPSDAELRKMAQETGGRVFHVDRKHTLESIFDELQQELRSQYAIGYAPTNSRKDGSFRRVEIETKDKNLKVQARKGYYAIRPGAE